MNTSETNSTSKPNESVPDVLKEMRDLARPHDIFGNGEQLGTRVFTGNDLIDYADRINRAYVRDLGDFEQFLINRLEPKIRKKVVNELIQIILHPENNHE